MENLNLLFYKTFYSKLGQGKLFEDDISAKSKKLVSARFYKENYKIVCSGMKLDRFMLKTAYPGLLAGTGYAHGVDSDDDIKIGFSFDYVTGQPYIPGSSVKGLLRSYFEGEKKDAIVYFLNDDNLNVDELKKSIFGSNDEDGVDIFFDAVVRRGDEKGRVMGYDAITPHGEDLTQNPISIKILKVLPDVVFEFSFKLADSVVDGKTVTAEKKKDLFIKILKTFGIGAKTNVGYGILTEFEEEELDGYKWPDRNAGARSVLTNHNDRRKESCRERGPVEISEIKRNEKPIEGRAYRCTVTGVTDFGIFVEIDGTRYFGLIHISKLGVSRNEDINDYFTKGQKVTAKYLGTNDKGKLAFDFVK